MTEAMEPDAERSSDCASHRTQPGPVQSCRLVALVDGMGWKRVRFAPDNTAILEKRSDGWRLQQSLQGRTYSLN